MSTFYQPSGIKNLSMITWCIGVYCETILVINYNLYNINNTDNQCLVSAIVKSKCIEEIESIILKHMKRTIKIYDNIWR